MATSIFAHDCQRADDYYSVFDPSTFGRCPLDPELDQVDRLILTLDVAVAFHYSTTGDMHTRVNDYMNDTLRLFFSRYRRELNISDLRINGLVNPAFRYTFQNMLVNTAFHIFLYMTDSCLETRQS